MLAPDCFPSCAYITFITFITIVTFPPGKKNPELLARGREADFVKGSKAR